MNGVGRSSPRQLDNQLCITSLEKEKLFTFVQTGFEKVDFL